MKSRINKILLLFTTVLALAGCGKAAYPDLPGDATAFETDTFIDTDGDGTGYLSITFAGRTYIGYGTLGSGKTLRRNDMEQCIGYIVLNKNSSSVKSTDDTGRRLYILSDDPAHHYLLERDTVGFMNNPSFWRAVDTQGMDTFTPDYIDRLEYVFWE